ncbi:MAG: 2-amino-4-hydroxy-6-hydroxymethyldihydropteridine diphosphokinase [Steroidobacteraceae bacterium]
MQLWRPAYIGVGSNLDDPAGRVRAALAALARLPDTRSLRSSGLWRSVPFGPVQQPDFINAAAALLTTLEAPQLLARLRALEAQLGRERGAVRWGPRHIDLDLLALGAVQMQTPELTLPHAGIVERNFVLYPLADIAPEAWIPALGRVADLAARLPATGLERLS